METDEIEQQSKNLAEHLQSLKRALQMTVEVAPEVVMPAADELTAQMETTAAPTSGGIPGISSFDSCPVAFSDDTNEYGMVPPPKAVKILVGISANNRLVCAGCFLVCDLDVGALGLAHHTAEEGDDGQHEVSDVVEIDPEIRAEIEASGSSAFAECDSNLEDVHTALGLNLQYQAF